MQMSLALRGSFARKNIENKGKKACIYSSIMVKYKKCEKHYFLIYRKLKRPYLREMCRLYYPKGR